MVFMAALMRQGIGEMGAIVVLRFVLGPATAYQRLPKVVDISVNNIFLTLAQLMS
jgi:hypothetical protein